MGDAISGRSMWWRRTWTGALLLGCFAAVIQLTGSRNSGAAPWEMGTPESFDLGPAASLPWDVENDVPWSNVVLEAEDNGFVGIYADPEGTNPCATVGRNEKISLYLVATTGFATQAGLLGASFRIEVTNPKGYFFAFVPPDEPNHSVGLPIDIHPENPRNGAGMLFHFDRCQTITHQAGDRIGLGRLEVVNLNGGPTEILVKGNDYGWSPAPEMIPCEYDIPITASPMRRCTTDRTGEWIAARASLNDPSCEPQRSCSEDCPGKPCVDFAYHATPSRGGCPGDAFQLQMKVWNCGDSPADVQVFREYEEIATLQQLAPGDTMHVVHDYTYGDCPRGWVALSTVATNDVCPEPSGKLLVLGSGCGTTECEGPTCPVVGLSSYRGGEVGESFFAWIWTQRMVDLFGLSGRLTWPPESPLQVVSVQCVDEAGLPLDLGPDGLCYSRIDNEQGIVDFSVSRSPGAFGTTGALHLARVEFLYPGGTEPGICTYVRLEEPHAIDSFGRPLCVEPPGAISGFCSSTTCRLWPGDTNNDGTVDAEDIVALAAHWGRTGPVRHGRGCFWKLVEADCWPERDATFSDCFGDGVVGGEDLLCVGANWGRVHPLEGLPVAAPRAAEVRALRPVFAEMLGILADARAVEPGLGEMKQALQALLENDPIPGIAKLEANVPNPFNPSTRIRYAVPTSTPVTLAVYDVLGRRIRLLVDRIEEPGRHSVVWDGRDETGRDVASGVYVCKAYIGGEGFAHKMVLAR